MVRAHMPHCALTNRLNASTVIEIWLNRSKTLINSIYISRTRGDTNSMHVLAFDVSTVLLCGDMRIRVRNEWISELRVFSLFDFILLSYCLNPHRRRRFFDLYFFVLFFCCWAECGGDLFLYLFEFLSVESADCSHCIDDIKWDFLEMKFRARKKPYQRKSTRWWNEMSIPKWNC